MAKFEDSIGYVLAHEGGYSDHPQDPGGCTFWGISLKWLKSQGKDIDGDGDVDAHDIGAITEETARQIYLGLWQAANVDLIESQIIATKVFDLTVNMGRVGGTKRLQEAVNDILATMRAKQKPAKDSKASTKKKSTKKASVIPDDLDVDGGLGPITVAAVNAVNASDLLGAIRVRAALFYTALVDRNADLECFLAGWLVRAAA